MYSVTLARKPLVNALQALKRIAPTRSPKPILTHALLRIDPDARRVTLTATDLERTLSVALPADDIADRRSARDTDARQIHADDVATRDPLAWTLPIADALQALKTLPDASVTLAPFALRHACGSIELQAFAREAFPILEPTPVGTLPDPVTYPASALVRAVERVAPFCAKEGTRYAYNGAQFDALPDSFTAVATDGRRLIIHAHNADPLAPTNPARTLRFILPLTACKVLPALLKGSASVTLQALEVLPEPPRTQGDDAPDSSGFPAPFPASRTASQLRLTFGAFVLDVLPIDGKFPPYHEVCPTFTADAPPVTLQASDAAALVPLVRAGSSVIPDGMHGGAHGSQGTRIDAMLPDDVRPDRPALRLHARYEGRTSAATLPVTVSGRSGHIGVNAEFFAECLDAVGPVGVTIRWNAANRPIRLDPQTGDCVVVLMPVNLSDPALDVRNARYLRRAQLRHALQATPEVPTAGPPALLTRAERAALAPTVRRLQASAPHDLTTPDAIRLARDPDADPPVLPNHAPGVACPHARPRRASRLQGVPEWLASLPQIPDWSAAPVGLVYSNDRQTAWEFLGVFPTYDAAARVEADRPHDYIAILPFTVDEAGNGKRHWFATRRLTGDDVRAALSALQATPAPTPDALQDAPHAPHAPHALDASDASDPVTPDPTPARPAGDAPHAPDVVHAFDPALCVRIAADDVASLRRVDVARVLDNAPPERLDDVACYIVANRPDLRGAVYTARGDILAERLDALERDALQATPDAPAPTPDPVTPAGAAGDAPNAPHAWTRDALQEALQDARAKFRAEPAPDAFRRLAMATSTRYPNADALAPFASRIGVMTDAELRDASDWCTRELPAYLAPALVEMIRDALDARAAIEAADALQDAPTPARDPSERQIQPTPTPPAPTAPPTAGPPAPTAKRRTSGPTRETFIANYAAALRRTWAWADDADRLARFMSSVRETLTTKRTPWDWDTRIAREVFHALHGAHVRYTLRALRAMPAGDAPDASDALQDVSPTAGPPARPTLAHSDADIVDPDRVDVDPVRILAYRTIEQVTTALGIPPTYDTDTPVDDRDDYGNVYPGDALAWYLQADDEAPDAYAGAAIAVRSVDGSHVDRVWTVQTPADDASRQLAAKLFGDALHDSPDVQTFRDAMDAARGQAHMPEYADRPGFADAVDLARAALGKRTPDPARDPEERQIQTPAPPLYLVPAGPHTLDKTRELDAMQALLSRHPAWGARPVSLDDALRSPAVPLALKLAYLDATRSLTSDVVARYRAELVPTVTPAPTPAPVEVKPIAPRPHVPNPLRPIDPDALDAAALARYAPLVDALQHVPALVPLLECLQAHARAQSRPLGAFPELSAHSPYRRSDPLASMLVELFYRLGWTAGQAKRKHLPPTGDVPTLKRELMQALQARAVAVAA
jgi:DNA polymerase III sliding clamp (beta) subunit (PCNA family)